MPNMIADNILESKPDVRKAPLWMPERVMFTPAALEEPWGQQILARVQSLDLPVEELPRNRLTGLRGEDERDTYNKSKRTLAVVTAPPSAFKLSPIPPSADWQFHIAEGCPAHCQYCYLAGSLSGPPVIRVFANLPQILGNLAAFERSGETTTFEASCYTDPLGIEHLQVASPNAFAILAPALMDICGGFPSSTQSMSYSTCRTTVTPAAA